MKEPHHAVTPINFEITVRLHCVHPMVVCTICLQLLSGQNLIIPSKKTASMEIHYETHGIPHDCEQKKYMISSVSHCTSLFHA